ncbi:GntR family transcriptional regulator [Lacticaseibacillus parakribbianus]|uniref:GntR family transcriptional regulator n=1 Tax=Lacticaseibacillus parakribbianus TaxID=2970927 RepID=UPI0021CAE621|nr:GntR family transcriptional regulator [Lacticaseibacillus parakribbianus]
MTKYQELFDQLRTAILRGEYAPDALLPSENALAIRYHVSRITTKRALNELVKADLIYRVQGKGSFVKPHAANRSRTLLLVLPFANPKMGDYASGITQMLAGTTWRLETITTRQFKRLALDTFTEHYAGMFFYPQELSADMPTLITLSQLHIPTVVFDEPPSTLALPSVCSDNTAGGALAARHLQALGHKRIAFCSRVPFWQDWTGTVADRFFGYVNAYQPTDLMPTQQLLWAEALSTFASVAETAAYLKHEHITALIMGNDVEAIKVARELQGRGWQLPLDLSIVGFDDIELAATNSPSLTTLTQDFTEMGRQAVDLMLSQINDPQKGLAKRVTVPVKLVARDSTAAPATPR